jgi:hypothetical protein
VLRSGRRLRGPPVKLFSVGNPIARRREPAIPPLMGRAERLDAL